MRCSSEDTHYREVQGLSRGIQVLAALNVSPGSTASVAELSERVDLHRTTVKRLLETLRTLGVVRYLRASNAYCLTFRVRQLCQGFRDEVWISEIASPALRQLTAKILWPSDTLTLDEDRMVVRDSTHPVSRLSFTRGAIGIRVPILWAAGGRAYLAFCPEDERAVLLKILRLRDDEEGAQARDERYVAGVIESTRQRGFATNDTQSFGSQRCAAIAVPIRHSDRVVATINIVYLVKAIRTSEVIDRFLPDLLATGKCIEIGIAESASIEPVERPGSALLALDHLSTMAVGKRAANLSLPRSA